MPDDEENLKESPSEDGCGPTMPHPHRGSVIEQGTSTGVPSSQGPDIGPPPSFGRQMLQLVVIPASIAIVAILVAVMFSVLSGTENNLEKSLATLRQSQGMGKGPLGAQDPKYKQKFQAAYFVAQSIRTIESDDKKSSLNGELVKIYNENTGEDEPEIQMFLVEAIGELGQPEGLSVLLKALDSPHPQVQQHAIAALMKWPDRPAAKTAVHQILATLESPDSGVRATAAWALGSLAEADDQSVRDALVAAMRSSQSVEREAVWGAAIALAKLGDERGIGLVLDVLLNREALSKLQQVGEGADAGQPFTEAAQSKVLILTLSHVPQMHDPRIWDRVRELADNDPDRHVRNQAKLILPQNPTNNR